VYVFSHRGLAGLFCVIYLQILADNVVYSIPSFSTQWDSITVYFDAAEGDQGLMGFTGDIWAHTGVITNNSTHPGDWKYVKTNWAQNTNDTQLTPLGNDLWILKIDFPHEYYGVPEDEQIIKLAFVFRNYDGSESGRDNAGSDIFLDLYEPGITTIISAPKLNYIFEDPRSEPIFSFPNEDVPIVITSSSIGTEQINLQLFLDDSLFAESSLDTLFTVIDLDPINIGMHKLTAVSIDTSQNSDSVDFYLMSHEYPTINQRPFHINDGINYNSDGTVSLSLFAPHKDFVYLIGDFNNWIIDENYYMKKDSGGIDSVHFWITIDNLISGTEYAFQYVVDGEIRIADPYADKVLDRWNDQYISDQIYSDLKPYPHGKTDHIVSILETGQEPYLWQHNTSFSRPPKEELIIYELLMRDFLEHHDYTMLMDTLNYLENLGINAIELLPVNEFEGNSSWGYGTSFYFAADKYYGSKETLKLFIDECHRRGIAVIMDIVLNHTYGQSPFVRLYSEGGYPTEENPWYNTESNFFNPLTQWGHDLDHESIHTQILVDRINQYWIEYYNIDGYRFDFTKGIGNNIKDSDDPWGSNYDSDRIRLLKRLANAIWEYDSTVYIILEHFAENSEELILSDYGMLLWGNSNYNYAEASMGYHADGKSDFSWGYYGNRGWSNPHLITYFESHDEERLMYKNISWGNNNATYNIREISTSLNRMKAIGAFFFTIPGPKMIWQFGELGYDISIDDPCRTCEKPIRWEYFEDQQRQNLYKTYKALIELRKEYPVFHSSETNVQLNVADPNGKKRIRLSHDNMKAIIIGNFGMVEQSIEPLFYHSGIWYDYFFGDSLYVQNVNEQISLSPGEFRIYTDSFIESPEQGILSAKIDENSFLKEFTLYPNYPNPFNLETTIIFSVSEHSISQLQIFDALGRLVDTLIDKKLFPGKYSIKWNASKYPSGIYFSVLKSKGKSSISKMILLK
tara:strand:+ start:2174 stop:5071 length:2898 start_codon:yes stop_codon:yes gene_type:complete